MTENELIRKISPWEKPEADFLILLNINSLASTAFSTHARFSSVSAVFLGRREESAPTCSPDRRTGGNRSLTSAPGTGGNRISAHKI